MSKIIKNNNYQQCNFEKDIKGLNTPNQKVVYETPRISIITSTDIIFGQIQQLETDGLMAGGES